MAAKRKLANEPEQNVSTQKQPPKPGFRRFNVATQATVIARGNDLYPVEGGTVDLPDNETWYNEMINAGQIAPEEPEEKNTDE